eukprot:CAMPEP_0174748568 /NCGR_PEP_ID=MMETSP1094-20130205/93813_1 /TAXON_ID=156173 /ORGANISM="Chrysochromulina brevifilum, Strain UTEX LB 985" /LENGTH=59 /DNA_ID=CAMNT_0015953633 /DNA_START=77 /DNA_END=256 /DNA_ORIENTATION=-
MQRELQMARCFGSMSLRPHLVQALAADAEFQKRPTDGDDNPRAGRAPSKVAATTKSAAR